jgi:hypothetical protein
VRGGIFEDTPGISVSLREMSGGLKSQENFRGDYGHITLN